MPVWIEIRKKQVRNFLRGRAESRVGIVKTFAVCFDAAMSQSSTRPTLYKGDRFPPEIISRCVWLYFRFGLSLRNVSELMLARGGARLAVAGRR